MNIVQYWLLNRLCSVCPVVGSMRVLCCLIRIDTDVFQLLQYFTSAFLYNSSYILY